MSESECVIIWGVTFFLCFFPTAYDCTEIVCLEFGRIHFLLRVSLISLFNDRPGLVSLLIRESPSSE